MNCVIADNTPYLRLMFLVVTLSGCCSSGVKPGEANLFQAGCGVASGQYKTNLIENQKKVEDSADAKSIEQKRAVNLESQLNSRQQHFQSAQELLEELQGENDTISVEIDNMHVETQQDQALQKRYSDQLLYLNNDIEALKNRLSEDSANEESKAQLDTLKREVETLRIIVLGQ